MQAVLRATSSHQHQHHPHAHHGGDPHHAEHHDERNSPNAQDSTRSLASLLDRNTHTHLTYSRHHLIDIAMETIKIAECGQYTNLNGENVELKKDLDWAVDHCVHYGDGFDFMGALRKFDLGVFGDDDVKDSCCVKAVKDSCCVKEGVERVERSEKACKVQTKENGNEEHPEEHPSDTTKSCSSKKLSINGQNTPLKFERTSFLVVSASWLEAASELLKAHTQTNQTNQPERSSKSSVGGSSNKSSVIFSSGIDNSFSSSTNSNCFKSASSNISTNYTRVGVLNSASSTTPGGRFLKGTVSQEDCLCRASLLYSCISQPKFQSENRFYGKNRSLRYGSSNCVIFSPDVPVIREDTVEGKLLDNYQKVSFVTIPAPNAFTTSGATGKEYNDIESDERQSTLSSSPNHLRKLSSVNLASLDTDANESFEKKREALHCSVTDRIHRALSAFVLGRCTDLVLPAFGCGVHGNDPSMVASVFREMLTDQNKFGGRFRTVVFAIPPSRKQNYQAFAAYFQATGAAAPGVVSGGVGAGAVRGGSVERSTLVRATTII